MSLWISEQIKLIYWFLTEIAPRNSHSYVDRTDQITLITDRLVPHLPSHSIDIIFMSFYFRHASELVFLPLIMSLKG